MCSILKDEVVGDMVRWSARIDTSPAIKQPVLSQKPNYEATRDQSNYLLENVLVIVKNDTILRPKLQPEDGTVLCSPFMKSSCVSTLTTPFIWT